MNLVTLEHARIVPVPAGLLLPSYRIIEVPDGQPVFTGIAEFGIHHLFRPRIRNPLSPSAVADIGPRRSSQQKMPPGQLSFSWVMTRSSAASCSEAT